MITSINLKVDIASIKKDLFMARIKASSGDNEALGMNKNKRRKIARFFTDLNKKIVL